MYQCVYEWLDELMYIWMNEFMCMCHACMDECNPMYAWLQVCMCMNACMYVCLHMFVCIVTSRVFNVTEHNAPPPWRCRRAVPRGGRWRVSGWHASSSVWPRSKGIRRGTCPSVGLHGHHGPPVTAIEAIPMALCQTKTLGYRQTWPYMTMMNLMQPVNEIPLKLRESLAKPTNTYGTKT